MLKEYGIIFYKVKKKKKINFFIFRKQKMKNR